VTYRKSNSKLRFSQTLNKSNLENIFITNLRNVLQEKRMTIVYLVQISGVAESHLGDILRGKSKVTLYTMDKICHALGLDPSAMLEE